MRATIPIHDQHQQQRKSTASIIAILAAVGGVVLTLTGHPYWGMLVGVAAFVVGAVALAMSASNRISGGILSISAIVLSILGLGMSVLVAIGLFIF